MRERGREEYKWEVQGERKRKSVREESKYEKEKERHRVKNR